MGNDNVINFILLGLIFALIIHLFFNVFNIGYKENYDPEPDIHQKEKKVSFVKKDCSRDPLSKKIFSEGNKEFLNEDDSNLSIDNNVDDYIRKILINDSINKKKSCKKYTRQEIDEYRNNFLSFNNNINQSSHNDDMVDRINDLYLSGNSDPTKDYHNLPIKDLFNYLTSGDIKN